MKWYNINTTNFEGSGGFWTPLIQAILSTNQYIEWNYTNEVDAERIEILKILIDNGADYSTADINNKLPIDYAAYPQLKQILEELQSHKNSFSYKSGMTTLTKKPETVFATDVWFADSKLYVRLTDGREIGVPIEWYARLRDASEEDLNNWRFIGRGQGIHWETLDEDLSVASFLKS